MCRFVLCSCILFFWLLGALDTFVSKYNHFSYNFALLLNLCNSTCIYHFYNCIMKTIFSVFIVCLYGHFWWYIYLQRILYMKKENTEEQRRKEIWCHKCWLNLSDFESRIYEHKQFTYTIVLFLIFTINLFIYCLLFDLLLFEMISFIIVISTKFGQSLPSYFDHKYLYQSSFLF